MPQANRVNQNGSRRTKHSQFSFLNISSPHCLLSPHYHACIGLVKPVSPAIIGAKGRLIRDLGAPVTGKANSLLLSL